MSSSANKKHGEVSVTIYLENSDKSPSTLEEILTSWMFCVGHLEPKGKLARKYSEKIYEFHYYNKYDQDTLCFSTKTEPCFSDIAVRSSSLPGSIGVFSAWVSPRRRQNPCDLLKLFMPFMTRVSGLPYITFAGAECIDIAIDINDKTGKHNISQPLFVSVIEVPEDCYIEVEKGTNLYILKDEILYDEPLLKKTLMYLSCSLIQRVYLGLWKRPWRK